MLSVKSFTFNDFAENTYVLLDDQSGECLIIDPGCCNALEENILADFIAEKKLKPVHLINTHCHIDHVLGNKFVSETYGLVLTAHKKEAAVLQSAPVIAGMYQIEYKTSPEISVFADEGDVITCGQYVFEVLFTPGHSPASISLLNREAKILIAGDVLFAGSIGRTDLPGGNFETLIRVIKSKFFTLPDDYTVYPGHGDTTTIGVESRTNPFF